MSQSADLTGALWAVIGVAALAGGVLSTWSPCGYSSISLLRPNGRGVKAAIGWLPTFAMHGVGYAVGAVILGTLLGAIGALAGFTGFASTVALSVLAIIGLLYGAHQLDFLRVPYPQRRAQVPHDARNRFPKWVIGGLYGLSLGLDYLTYVQTPLLYMMTLAAVFTGHIPAAIAVIALFNLGRYLPVAVNLLPCKDYAIQAWLARNQERAAIADGAILVALGAAFAVLALI
ncbi:methylamine utilization protein MauF [Paracoccus aminophilus]